MAHLIYLSLAATLSILGLFALLDSRIIHVFAIPTTICGTFCLTFFIHGVKQRRHLLDLRLLVAALGFYIVFLAPILHVYLDYRILALPNQPEDFRPWFTVLGCLNMIGLAVFMGVCSRAIKIRPKAIYPTWLMDTHALIGVGFALIFLSVALQVYVYRIFGGFSGYVNAYLHDPQAWENTGWLMIISESGPVLTVLMLAGLRQQKPDRRPIAVSTMLVCSVVFVGCQFLFGGLRGSRAHLVVTCFFAASLAHRFFRPLPNKVLGLAAVALVAFTYFYTFFKDWGFQGASVMFDPDARASLSKKSGRTVEQLFLSDFNRSDIQAFVLQEIEAGHLQYAYGQTYLGALSLLIPRVIWPERLPTKLKWTTELERGSGSYESSFYRSSRMYGQVAEAMLNFGYFGVPLAFAVLGFVVGKIVGFSDSLAPEDARRLVLPGMIICSIHMFVQDSENILYFGVKYLLLPVTLVFFLSRRRRVRGKRGLAARMARAPILQPSVCPEVSESNWEHVG